MDIGIAWDTAHFRGDWTVVDGGLGTDPGIRSAVELSLFTDARASADFTPTDGTDNRRGWWGDTYLGRPLGSRLWQLNRAKKLGNKQLLLQARDYCLEALQWLTDAGAAARVDVQTYWVDAQRLGIAVTVVKPSGSYFARRYERVWEGVA